MSGLPEMTDDVVSDCQLNVYNFQALKARPAARYDFLRFDPNNNCNLRCVYCHNHRSEELINEREFGEFLHSKIVSVARFQVGCIMEPTLDKRLIAFMLMIADSPAKPTIEFVLQTNGILIHQHDPLKMKEAGLTRLSISMDAADPETQRSLRGGTSLQKVIRNVSGFLEACPTIAVEFVTTVTSANIDGVQGLVRLGIDLGIRKFIFREVFYYPDNDIVDHSRMPGLLLVKEQFTDMAELIKAQFGTQADLVFANSDYLDASARNMIKNSGFSGRELSKPQFSMG